MNGKVEKILACIVVFIIFSIGILCYDYTENPIHSKFNHNVAIHHNIERCLNFTKIYSRITKKETKCSWYFRNLLMKHYIDVKKSYPDTFYNSIGLFYSILNDFRFLYTFNENNEALTIDEKEQYEKYKQMFILQLQSLLMEYRQRNESISNFIGKSGWRSSSVYKIPNRITFYPELAGIYLALVGKNFSISDDTLENLKYLYETFDVVYNQEKGKYTKSFYTLNHKLNRKQYDKYYPYFVIDCTRNIILLTHVLHPEIEICSTSDVCEKYREMSLKIGEELDPKIMSIIKEIN